ncbi:MAG: hypothetical protein JO162_04005 [Alphaproteobacteria bacterium]|nr:hypothetical protein [Alphaproteobacteria bacterium]
MIASYLPHLDDLAGPAVTWGVGLVLAFAGTGLAGRRFGIECRMIAGWGVLCIVMTVWGVLVPANLRWPAAGFVVAAAATQLFPAVRLQRGDWQAFGRLLLLTLPLWLIMAPIRPSQSDTFAYFLPNATYLVDYGRFPTAFLPPSASALPAAPYNGLFLTFLGSLADGGFPASGLSLVNVLLLLTAGMVLARAIAWPPVGAEEAPSWPLMALGFLLATLLNPGFVPRIDFAGWAETALAVTALFAAWLFVVGQGELGAGARPKLPVALCLVLAAMVNAKQSGIGLVLALAGAAVIAGWAERGMPRQALIRYTAVALVPALLLYGLWRYYASYAGVAELTPLPWDEWHWAILPETLRSIGRIVSEKPVYFGGVAIAILALPPMLRRFGWIPTTRLLALHAAAFVLYNGYLMAAYIAHFSGEMSAEAHSYFRYNTHLSLVLVLALALTARDLAAGRELFARIRRPVGAALVILAVLVPIGFAYRLRFDLVMPQPLVWNLAQNAKPYLKDGDRLALLLPGDNGSVADMLSGILTEVAPQRRLELLRRQTADDAAFAEAAQLGYPLALVSCTGAAENAAALLEHDGEGWHRRAVWPYPPEARAQRWQHILSWPALCR